MGSLGMGSPISARGIPQWVHPSASMDPINTCSPKSGQNREFGASSVHFPQGVRARGRSLRSVQLLCGTSTLPFQSVSFKHLVPHTSFFLFLMVFTQNQLVPRENFGLDKTTLYPGK